MKRLPNVDVLHIIRTRLDHEHDARRGNPPQLRKDVIALQKAEREIVRLRAALEGKTKLTEVTP